MPVILGNRYPLLLGILHPMLTAETCSLKWTDRPRIPLPRRARDRRGSSGRFVLGLERSEATPVESPLARNATGQTSYGSTKQEIPLETAETSA